MMKKYTTTTTLLVVLIATAFKGCPTFKSNSFGEASIIEQEQHGILTYDDLHVFGVEDLDFEVNYDDLKENDKQLSSDARSYTSDSDTSSTNLYEHNLEQAPIPESPASSLATEDSQCPKAKQSIDTASWFGDHDHVVLPKMRDLYFKIAEESHQFYDNTIHKVEYEVEQEDGLIGYEIRDERRHPCRHRVTIRNKSFFDIDLDGIVIVIPDERGTYEKFAIYDEVLSPGEEVSFILRNDMYRTTKELNDRSKQSDREKLLKTSFILSAEGKELVNRVDTYVGFNVSKVPFQPDEN